MIDDFTRTQIKRIATNDPACIKTLAGNIREKKNTLECSVNNFIEKGIHPYTTHPESCLFRKLQKDFYIKNAEQELEQKKIISGLIRQKFVDTAINIPNKTTKSIIEWYMMIPCDTFLKYVEWYKENGYSF